MTKKGYKQTPEHIEKRISHLRGVPRPDLAKFGSANPMWKGDNAGKDCARYRAVRAIPVPKGYERHHIDGNTHNNDPSNIQVVTRREHMRLDGRLEWVRHHGHKWKKGQCGNPNGRPRIR